MIDQRLWLHLAKSLPVGQSGKYRHEGCGDRESLHVANEGDRYWCYCHRCRDSGQLSKDCPTLVRKVPKETGYIPKRLLPAHRFPEVMETILFRNLSRWVSQLWYAPDTQRLYLPDDSASYTGFDTTRKAIALVYSPTDRYIAYTDGDDTLPMLITDDMHAYLSHYGPRLFFHGRKGAKEAAQRLVCHGGRVVYWVDDERTARELRALGGVPLTH